MGNIKKRLFIIIIIAACVSFLAIAISAHSGKTDSHGGHYDRSTGEYHYHHGYPAHDHYDIDGDGDIDCPYTYKYYADNSNSSNSGNNTQTESNIEKANENKNENKFGEIVCTIFEFTAILLFVAVVGYTIVPLITEIIFAPLLAWVFREKFKSNIKEEKIRLASYIVVILLIIVVIAIVVSALI